MTLLVVVAGLLMARTAAPGIAPDRVGSQARSEGEGSRLEGSRTPRLLAGESTLRLQNRRTGVTCAMTIVPVEPTMDPGIFGNPVGDKAERGSTDPMVRPQLSPCVE
jgi:hypothetical protein